MNITIRRPLGYSQIGRKDRQEDAVWPIFNDVTASDRCFVLCDGVGGSEHGEVASQVSSRVIGEYLASVIRQKDAVTAEDVNAAVGKAYDALEAVDTDNADGERVSMATTLTCVCLHSEGITAAHMGDSRIYHIRPGQGMLYQSSDHSLVNMLLQSGELTPEEAKTFPRKNVITRAIQPHGGNRFNAETHLLADVQSGDYIFLCCDGVLEQLTAERLVEVLSMTCSDAEKIRMLQAEGDKGTKDNYTAYLIPIDKVTGAAVPAANNADDANVVAAVVDSSAHSAAKSAASKDMPTKPATKQRQSLWLWAAALLVVVVAAGCGYFYFHNPDEPNAAKTETLPADSVNAAKEANQEKPADSLNRAKQVADQEPMTQPIAEPITKPLKAKETSANPKADRTPKSTEKTSADKQATE